MPPSQQNAIPKRNEEKNGPSRQKNGMWARWMGIAQVLGTFVKKAFLSQNWK